MTRWMQSQMLFIGGKWKSSAEKVSEENSGKKLSYYLILKLSLLLDPFESFSYCAIATTESFSPKFSRNISERGWRMKHLLLELSFGDNAMIRKRWRLRCQINIFLIAFHIVNWWCTLRAGDDEWNVVEAKGFKLRKWFSEFQHCGREMNCDNLINYFGGLQNSDEFSGTKI